MSEAHSFHSASTEGDPDATQNNRRPRLIGDELNNQPKTHSLEFAGNTYVRVRELGSGAIGTVFLYENNDPHASPRQLAIKKVRESDKNVLAEEAEAINRLGSMENADQNALEARRRLVEEGLIVMDYVPGCALSDVVPKGEVLPPEQALHLVYKIARELVKVHGLGITHRDVKPTNIMVTPEGEVRMLDYGASQVGRNMAEQKFGMGTPVYMSPEQINEPYTGNNQEDLVAAKSVTDVYALGHLLHQVSTGRALADKEGNSVMGTLISHRQGFDDEIRLLPPYLRDLLLGALSYKEKDRIPMPAFAHKLAEECRRRGIDPDAPLFTKLESDADPTPEQLREAMNTSQTKTTIDGVLTTIVKRVRNVFASEKVVKMTERERAEKRLGQNALYIASDKVRREREQKERAEERLARHLRHILADNDSRERAEREKNEEDKVDPNRTR